MSTSAHVPGYRITLLAQLQCKTYEYLPERGKTFFFVFFITHHRQKDTSLPTMSTKVVIYLTTTRQQLVYFC